MLCEEITRIDPDVRSDLGITLDTTLATQFQGPLLLPWINFNSSIDKKLQTLYSMGWKYLYIP